MPFTIKLKGTKKSFYPVSGKTLAEINNEMQKKGPVNGGKRHAGKANVKIVHSYKKWVRTGKDKKGNWRAEMTIHKGVFLITPEVIIPKLTSAKALSKAAMAEWNRFYKKLVAHEEKHIQIGKKECAKLAKEFEALIGKGEGKTEDEAVKAAQKDFAKKLEKRLSPAKVNARLKAAQDAFDATTKHGEKQGAKLDAKIK